MSKDLKVMRPHEYLGKSMSGKKHSQWQGLRVESAWNNQEASMTEVSEGEKTVGDNVKEVRDGVEANLLGLGRPLEGL